MFYFSNFFPSPLPIIVMFLNLYLSMSQIWGNGSANYTDNFLWSFSFHRS